MSDRYLEVTYRGGRALAAYLYLPRVSSEKTVRTEKAAPGLLVDFAADGRPIGVEITSPRRVTVEALNAVLDELHVERLDSDEAAPLRAA